MMRTKPITEMKTEYVTEQTYKHKTEPQIEGEQEQETYCFC
jgi:hypothetical protein